MNRVVPAARVEPNTSASEHSRFPVEKGLHGIDTDRVYEHAPDQILQLDPYDHMNTGTYATYYVDHRMEALRESVGWDLRTLGTLPFMVWVRRVEIDFLRPARGDQEITIMLLFVSSVGGCAHPVRDDRLCGCRHFAVSDDRCVRRQGNESGSGLAGGCDGVVLRSRDGLSASGSVALTD